ncbi:hypothetical protein ACTMTJ_15795 [Phytohabitans sp. LJ34]|uniref:hypothetical protein n=1 Tax=Phytohabitans sp. LJ34 TaxID=3452217 RepID=UPI003F8C39A0
MASVDDVALHAGNAWPAPDQVRLYTRVLAYVLADDRGVTIRRLAARLGLSTRLVRAVVYDWQRAGLVTCRPGRGWRAHRYSGSEDMWSAVLARGEEVLGRGQGLLDALAADLDSQPPAAGRAAEAVRFVAFLRGELPALVERWQEHRRGREAEARRPVEPEPQSEPEPEPESVPEVRAWQLAAAHALVDLLARPGMPALTWHIDMTEQGLFGLIHRDDEKALATLETWARFFGTAVRKDRFAGYTLVEAKASHMGVPVKLSGHTDRGFR